MRLAVVVAVCLALLPVGAAPQATSNEVYVLAALTGQLTYKQQTVRIDAPIALVADAAGVLHLALPAKARGEVPAQTATGWQLAHVPIAGASCFRNGLYQTQGLDYALAGAAIATTSWNAGDTLACDYEW